MEVENGKTVIFSEVQARGGAVGAAARASMAEVARDLDLHDHVLRRWVNLYQEEPVHAFPVGGQMKPKQPEIAALKREINKLEASRDLLIKATAFFRKASH